MNKEKAEGTKEVSTSVTQPQEKSPTVQPPISNEKTLAEPMKESVSQGLNLMPQMSEEQKEIEVKKSTFNLGSAVSLVTLVSLSLLIVGFNIVSKQMRNSTTNELYATENALNQKIDIMVANNSIFDRVLLYDNVKKKSFSHKEVVEFIQTVTTKIGNIQLTSIEISDTLAFAIEGSASSLEDVSKLWYLFGVNDNIETVNLKNVGKTDNGTRFTFEGKLVSENFINK